jgi:hypothetical protein
VTRKEHLHEVARIAATRAVLVEVHGGDVLESVAEALRALSEHDCTWGDVELEYVGEIIEGLIIERKPKA